MKYPLTRRRFLQGSAALTGSLVLAGCSDLYKLVSPAEAAAVYYPPALTGLRGDHDGSQSAAHRLALKGEKLTFPDKASENYDLVVIGAGISGLTAAYLYRKARPQAKVLILDNHDDFGGHAKRNEFQYNGKTYITYGGSESLDSPKTSFSEDAHALLKELGVDYTKFEQYFDQDLYENTWKLQEGSFFNEEVFGKAAVVAGLPEAGEDGAAGIIAGFPLADADKAALVALYTEPEDYLKGKQKRARIEYADSTSYYDFLKDKVQLPEGALNYLKDISSEYWGHPISAISVAEAFEEGYPGVQNLGLPEGEESEEEPYIYHFPDGNASIARLLVRKLIPAAAAGSTMEDIVTAAFDYAKLDLPEHDVRIRLNSTALLAQNNDAGVAVAYLKHGDKQLVQVQAKQCIFAGHSALAARVIPEMAEPQKTAAMTNVKVPMVYAKMLMRNAEAFKKLGVYSLYAPQSAYCFMQLDDPVNIGDYRVAQSPSEPVILHAVRIATDFEGKTARDKYRSGRRKLLEQDLVVLKAQLFEQMRSIYSLADENFDETLLDITFNRWAHGYSYEQVGLWDSDQTMEAATETMQQAVGNIFMAGSDVAWMPYLQDAVDQAYRAVKEAVGK